MRRMRSWLVLFFLGPVSFGLPASSRAASPDDGQPATVRFELYRDYLIVLQARVGPLKGLNFLLDTGATPTVIDPHLAGKLHLQSTATDIAVLQGTAHGATATLPNLEVGSLVRENLPVLVEDLSFVQKVVPVHLDGIVGMDVLGQSAFTIDYVAHEIRFGPVNEPTAATPLDLAGGLVFIDATVNDQSARLLLDTGAPSLFLFKRLPAPGGQTTAFQVSSASIGDHDQKTIRLNSLAVGSTTFSHPLAYFIATPGDSAHNFDGLISPAALGIARISVDLSRREVAFSVRR